MPPPRSRVAAAAAPPVNAFSVSLVLGCVSLAASGAVPHHDLAFSLAWPAYLWAVNRWRFRRNAALQQRPPGPLVAKAWVRSYAACAAVLALLLPSATCLACRSDAAVLRALGPHLYLTSAQVVCEFFTGDGHTAALPRMLVPIGFNAYRMCALAAWCGAAAAGLGPWHLGLAAANLALWAYNLFGFLLLDMLPRYLDPAKCAT